jgi:hypothetical protein
LASDGIAVYLSGGQELMNGNYAYRGHVWKFDGVALQRQAAGATLFMAGGSNGGINAFRDLWASTDDGSTWSSGSTACRPPSA